MSWTGADLPRLLDELLLLEDIPGGLRELHRS